MGCGPSREERKRGGPSTAVSPRHPLSSPQHASSDALAKSAPAAQAGGAAAAGGAAWPLSTLPSVNDLTMSGRGTESLFNNSSTLLNSSARSTAPPPPVAASKEEGGESAEKHGAKDEASAPCKAAAAAVDNQNPCEIPQGGADEGSSASEEWLSALPPPPLPLLSAGGCGVGMRSNNNDNDNSEEEEVHGSPTAVSRSSSQASYTLPVGCEDQRSLSSGYDSADDSRGTPRERAAEAEAAASCAQPPHPAQATHVDPVSAEPDSDADSATACACHEVSAAAAAAASTGEPSAACAAEATCRVLFPQPQPCEDAGGAGEAAAAAPPAALASCGGDGDGDVDDDSGDEGASAQQGPFSPEQHEARLRAQMRAMARVCAAVCVEVPPPPEDAPTRVDFAPLELPLNVRLAGRRVVDVRAREGTQAAAAAPPSLQKGMIITSVNGEPVDVLRPEHCRELLAAAAAAAASADDAEAAACRVTAHVPAARSSEHLTPALATAPAVARGLEAARRVLGTFAYTTEGATFNVEKKRTMAELLGEARTILRDGVAIQCVEGTFVGLLLTHRLSSVQRFSVSFESVTPQGTVYKHIVLGLRHERRYGALGISRNRGLMTKEVVFPTLPAMLADFIVHYNNEGHIVHKILLSRPIPRNDAARPDWKAGRFCQVASVPWSAVEQRVRLFENTWAAEQPAATPLKGFQAAHAAGTPPAAQKQASAARTPLSTLLRAPSHRGPSSPVTPVRGSSPKVAAVPAACDSPCWV